jgi:hypothetical protein
VIDHRQVQNHVIYREKSKEERKQQENSKGAFRSINILVRFGPGLRGPGVRINVELLPNFYRKKNFYQFTGNLNDKLEK